MNESVQIAITLAGGLALFIFGMNYMSEGLQRAAGERMKNILAMLTRNPVMGILAGTLVTAVIQSSSATTVLVIGFVSAGLMQLRQAISVIFGANIGTTVTAQLVAFNIGDYAWAFVFIGFLMFFFLSKHEKVSEMGQVLFGFGVLFVGINVMSDVMVPLAHKEFFTDLMIKVSDSPGLGVLVGAFVTAIIQSSSAFIAVLQNLAATAGPDGTSLIGLAGAIPIMFGSNIGTTITAVLASIGASLNAKRVALAHIIFNVTGTLIFIWFVPLITRIVQAMPPSGPELEIISREIANAHLLFNVATVIIFLPLIGILTTFVCRALPGSEKDTMLDEPMYLDNKILDRPAFAIHLAKQELLRLGGYTLEMLANTRKAFIGSDMEKANEVLETESNVDKLQDHIVAYLSQILATDTANIRQAEQVSDLMHIAADIEHIGDNCENLAELAIEKHRNNYEFSDTAYSEIFSYYDQAQNMMKDAYSALEKNDHNMANQVVEQEDGMNRTEERLRYGHMQRLADNTCSPAFTVIYMDAVHNMEKIGDYCNNIAEAVLRTNGKDELSELHDA